MRRIFAVISSAALALGLALSLQATSAQAAAGYDSAYQFESAFLTLHPGDTGTFSVFFANTGATAWVAGSPSQVNLGVCGSDKVTCNIPSINGAFASGWLSTSAYATAAKSVVAPGDFSAFTYSIKVPAGQAQGTYRFNGDLVIGSTGERIHPEGYYQDVTISGPGIPTLGFTPDFTRDEDNEASATVPGNGQHTYTVQTTLTGTLTFATLDSSNVVRNADGTYSFCDKNQDKKADGIGASPVLFTAFNGTSVAPSTELINEPIPSSGTMTVTIDSSTKNQRVRVVAWQDTNQNAQLDLTTTGADTTCATFTPYDPTADGAIAVSGRKYYFPAQGQFGSQFPGSGGSAQCEPVYRHDTTNQVFSAGPTTDTSLRFYYDANDLFQISNTRVSLDVFKANLAPAPDGMTGGSSVSVNYDPNPSGFSTFNICTLSGYLAPNNVSAATGNFDNGTIADDVRISFAAPSSNQGTSYSIQRANLGATTTATTINCTNSGAPNDGSAGTPASSTFTTVGAVSVTAGQSGSFTNFDLADGGYCYRVTMQNPSIGVTSVSNYVPVNIPGTLVSTPPTSTSATLTAAGSGFAQTLGNGAKITFTFSTSMSLASPAVIRVTDSDCGQWTDTASPSQTACSGGNSDTVADIVCGAAYLSEPQNATCTLSSVSGGTNNQLLVTMTAAPSIISAGSVPGAQYNLRVTDSLGITDLNGNAWSVGTSPDTVFGPVGQ